MPFETAFLGKGLGAHITFKVFDVTVNSWNMFIQTAFLSELFAADVTRVRSFAGPGSSDGGVAVRRVVVSVDRWLVAERHVTQLTLDSQWQPELKQPDTQWYRWRAHSHSGTHDMHIYH